MKITIRMDSKEMFSGKFFQLCWWLSVHWVSGVQCVRQNSKMVPKMPHPCNVHTCVIPRPVNMMDITPMIRFY